MKQVTLAAAAILVAACSITSTQPQEIEAVNDFVASTKLTEVKEIRLNRQLSYNYLNDRYVTVSMRSGDYLVQLQRNCHELRQNDFEPEMVDRRDNFNVLRARFDTIRGCRISTIYEITEAQREELTALGDAPGDEIYMPDEEN